MDKKILIFLAIVGLVVIGMAIIQMEEPVDDFQRYSGTAREYSPHIAGERDSDSQSLFGMNTVAGICALYLMCYLFWFNIRLSQRDRQAELEANENSLYNISQETGRSEYELFQISAKRWLVSKDRIDQDFKRYMANQTMPFYAKDFVRRNQSQIDPSLMKEKEEVKPNSWQDWVKVLVIFPGSIILLISMIVGLE
jgi:uncharacterized membrane protein YciS (DUF1049 family)